MQQIINKGDKNNNQFGGVPRFRPAGTSESSSGTGAEVFSVVVPDERTNSIIVVGNKAGIAKIRRLVSRLDYPMRPDEQGGFFVYSLRHAEAEPIANMLNGIATESKKAQDQASQGARGGAGAGGLPMGANGQVQVGPASTAIFAGDVKISADKNTNSLVIVASKPDYETLRRLIAKLDTAKDQVFIKAVIMEMKNSDKLTWGMNLYKFDGNSGGIGRIGFRGTESASSIIDPANDLGAILGFGAGGSVHVKFSGVDYTVPSLLSFIQLAKATVNANVLSTPQIMALNNEEALIEVGDTVPVQQNNSIGANGVASTAPTREPITTKLTITPFISPDTDSVKLKLDQEVGSLSTVTIKASELAKNAIATSKRKIKTNIVVNSGDTAVLGGLMKDSDEETISKIPILGDIPVLGWLFKSNSHVKEKSNLMVFITPQIIRNEEDNDKLLSDKISERIDFITHSMSGRDPHGAYVDALPRRKASNAKPKTAPTDPADAVDATPSPVPAPEEPATETF